MPNVEHREIRFNANSETEVVSQTDYPPEELAHLAAVSFNQAMDFYSEEKDEICHRWAEKAIRLAKLMKDPEGDRLVKLFKDRIEGLF